MHKCEIPQVKVTTDGTEAGAKISEQLSQQVTNMTELRPMSVSTVEDGFTLVGEDTKNLKSMIEKKMHGDENCSMVVGTIGRSANNNYFESSGSGTGWALAGDLKAGDLKDGFNKKSPFPDKSISKDLDFATAPTLAPLASLVFDRVDTNSDGYMSKQEMNSAMNGDLLREKEKSMLKMIADNRANIDQSSRDGISMRDIKEFDDKVIRYGKELSLVRKFAPELADFARELNRNAKVIDDNHDGNFSREELSTFYRDRKLDFLKNPTAEGKRELNALGWGVFKYDEIVSSRQGASSITLDDLASKMISELHRQAPAEFRANFLNAKDRERVEHYRRTV